MTGVFSRLRDRLLGRGDSAITIPIFDGALRPNRILEDAEVLLELPSPEDIAACNGDLYVADGTRILRIESSVPKVVYEGNRAIAAFAVLNGGAFAIAEKTGGVAIVGSSSDRRWDHVDGRPLLSVSAITVRKNGRLLISDGSASLPYDQWCTDLMSRGKSGRLAELDPQTGAAKLIAGGLAYAFGVADSGEAALVSEPWKHRVVSYGRDGAGTTFLGNLPAYPSRIAPAEGGGYWLTAFAGRTQLVEFVLREREYCERMMAEVDPEYWIAPALSSGQSFLEPLQGAGVKMRGVLKPWAPPRSYGLVIRLSSNGQVLYSMHSRLDGRHHGIVAAAQAGDNLFVLSKGSRRILRLNVADVEAVTSHG